MISATDITITLDEIENLYNAPSLPPMQANYYSKLALLEFCGWLELSMDTIVKECSQSYLAHDKNKEVVCDFVDNIYGFSYKRHFRVMLMKLIGIIKLEQLENSLGGDFDILKSQLEDLYKKRCDVAHSNITGTTPKYDAPSTIKNNLTTLFRILQKIETFLTSM